MISTMLVASEAEVTLPGLKLLINNQWVASESGKTFATVNPFTGGHSRIGRELPYLVA